jgi:allantoate deiminase
MPEVASNAIAREGFMPVRDVGARAAARCDRLGLEPYSERADQLVRRYLTPAHGAALGVIGDWMTRAGMSVRLDGAANLIGRYEGDHPGAPALIIGSHIDSVRNAGRYDGPLGVMLGIDCVEALADQGRRLPFAIEVIAFGDEEGSRFPVAMTCSRALAGAFDAADLEMRDAEGVTLAQARAAFAEVIGEPLGDIAGAARRPGVILAYLEAHIEQGPVLESEGLGIGVVTAIAAQKRFRVRITGVAGHAGTTPMGLRRDPGPGAAEVILLIEQLCAGEAGLVGTVGQMAAYPGAPNVIPGAVEFSIDLRAPTAAQRNAAADRLIPGIRAIAARRGLEASIDLLQDLPESPCDGWLTDRLADAVRAVGVAPRRLQSGAAHDAMVMAGLCPTAMLFIRCRGGVSHNPAEWVDPEDAALAARAMLSFIENLAAAVDSGQRLSR